MHLQLREYDEVQCDHCGQPTSRLEPPVEIELCDDCDLKAIRQRELNEQTFVRAIRKAWTEGQK